MVLLLWQYITEVQRHVLAFNFEELTQLQAAPFL